MITEFKVGTIPSSSHTYTLAGCTCVHSRLKGNGSKSVRVPDSFVVSVGLFSAYWKCYHHDSDIRTYQGQQVVVKEIRSPCWIFLGLSELSSSIILPFDGNGGPNVKGIRSSSLLNFSRGT